LSTRDQFHRVSSTIVKSVIYSKYMCRRNPNRTLT
jgi:hypothetical protein